MYSLITNKEGGYSVVLPCWWPWFWHFKSVQEAEKFISEDRLGFTPKLIKVIK